MDHNNFVILGAGIAGIGAAYKLGNSAVIYEKRKRYGGLLDNFSVNGFRFDHAVHLSFANEKIVRSVFDKTPFHVHKPSAMNYSDGYWSKHPIQNNTYNLPVEEKTRIIKSFINRPEKSNISNYQEWLNFNYGKYFSKKYPARYTRKYWLCEPEDLTTEWVNKRMYQPSIDEVIEGALTDQTPNTFYAKEMRYPKKGGYRAFFEHIADKMDIRLSHKVSEIDLDEKLIRFQNGYVTSYKTLISSIPLPEIVKLIKKVPLNIQNYASKLIASSIALVSVGFRNKIRFPSLWFYIYDEDIPFARAYSPSMKSSDNVPLGKSSLQFEIYYTDKKPLKLTDNQLKIKVIESFKKMEIAQESDIEIIDVRHVKYGNVIFYHGMENDRKNVRDYLTNNGVISIGRFGEWDYLWSNQSFMSGYNCI